MSLRDFDPTRLLDLATSETKRWGGEEPGPAHLAYVCAERHTAAFEEFFGKDGSDDLTKLLDTEKFGGDEADVRKVLESSDDVRALVASLKDILAPLMREQSAPVAASTDDRPESATAADAPAQEPAEAKTAAESIAAGNDSARLVEPRAVDGRDAELAELEAQLRRTSPQPILVVGDRGVGRTALVQGVAHRLAEAGSPLQLVRVGAERNVRVESLLSVLLNADENTVVVVDDFDQHTLLGADNPDVHYLYNAVRGFTTTQARVVLTLTRRALPRLDLYFSDFVAGAVTVDVPVLGEKQVAAAVDRKAAELEEVYGVTIPPAIRNAALADPPPIEPMRQPGLAARRLDEACARAVVAGAKELDSRHLQAGGAHTTRHVETDLESALASRVKGQDDAIRAVSKRLALTRTGLDLRPERPNGVFLFVGPTGVGKTALAREIARHEYGGYDRLIRLDMSEYSDQWAISRLTGPMPGYVGSTEPDSWLTTKVASAPYSVVLLDEIEKAHRSVWNVFLQVFDAGRLTDSRGVTADFSHTTIVMTSNLGVREASSGALGFGNAGDTAERSKDRLLAAVKDQMPPELLNRLDEIAVFDALKEDSIAQISQAELDRVVHRLTADGWQLTVAPDVHEWLAKTGYDAAYGARHLQRNIERELLAQLALADTRRVTVSVDGDRLDVQPG